jgi:hypothetical protein
MSTYTRRGIETQAQPAALLVPPMGEPATGANEESIRVDGFAQVLAMLRIADPEFRESLLRRLAARDAQLVAQLRAELRNLDY